MKRLSQNDYDETRTWMYRNERYPKAFAISENWWKAWGAIDNLLLLRNFGNHSPHLDS